MRWNDRVYGESSLDDPGLVRLVATPTFQRLKGIKQAGPSAFAHPFKTVTRFEHSLGVYALLTRLGAPLRERVAGLLHDVSHTAFSHAVDFLFASEEQDHHESLKPLFLNRPDLRQALDALGFAPEEFYDDSIYGLLERPLPDLCGDRIDYFLRDGLAVGVVTAEAARGFLDHLVVADGRICLDSVPVARDAVARFAAMNRRWWAGPEESYIYNQFADALRLALASGALRKDDLLADDEHVLSCLRASRDPAILAKLESITRLDPDAVESFLPAVLPKTRWLDPRVVGPDGAARRLSELG
jgi:HD superfamily phosphohydrolase